MSNGKILPVLLGLILIVVVLGALAFWTCRPCGREPVGGATCGTGPCATSAVVPGSPAVTGGLHTAVVGETLPAVAVTSVSTNAIVATSALQIEEAEKRTDALAAEMSASYRQLGELRTSLQRSPEAQALREELEKDRKTLDEKLLEVPAIAALTAKRKAMLDEIAGLQVRQTDLAKRARADATNDTIKAEGRAVVAEIRQKGAALGDVTRQLDAAKQAQISGDAALTELTARIAQNHAKSRTAMNSDPRIQELERRIQSLAAESRQVGQRVRRGTVAPPVAPSTNIAVQLP